MNGYYRNVGLGPLRIDVKPTSWLFPKHAGIVAGLVSGLGLTKWILPMRLCFQLLLRTFFPLVGAVQAGHRKYNSHDGTEGQFLLRFALI